MSLQSKLFNRKTPAFLICLLIAATAWFISKLSKEYTYDLPYNVCIYSSINTASSNCATNVLYVRVKAKGFYVMQHMYSPVKLEIDVKRLKPTRHVNENNVVEYVLSTKLLQNTIKEAIGNAVQVEMIVTKNLTFENN